MGKKLTYEFVKQKFENRGYILLDTEYIGSGIKMAYLCPRHKDDVFYISYDNLKHGSGCPKCGRELAADKLKLSYDFVKSEFENRGYVLLEKEYINNNVKMRFLCPNHPDCENKINYIRFMRGQGCRACGIEKKY